MVMSVDEDAQPPAGNVRESDRLLPVVTFTKGGVVCRETYSSTNVKVDPQTKSF